MMLDKRALSDDGYVIDQNYTQNLIYGKYPSDWNGCGWIAAYNILHSYAITDDPGQVNAQMNRKLPYHGTHGTPVPFLISNLMREGIDVRRIYGPKKLLLTLPANSRVIIRYPEKMIPHYVSFIPVKGKCTGSSENLYRFFNVSDGCEDYVTTLRDFIKKHVWFPYVRILLCRMNPQNQE